MKKNKSVYVAIFFSMLIFSVVFGFMYQNDLNRPRVRHAKIPEYVHKVIEVYNEQAKNHNVADISFGPGNWSNEKDFGVKDGWDKESQDCFIIYYKKDREAKWQSNAKVVMKELIRKKDMMQETFPSRFKDPQRLNNRKLPIYLPPNDSMYLELVSRIGNDSIYKAKESHIKGFTFSEFGPLGFLTRGIVIKPAAFDVDLNETGSYREVALTGLKEYNEWAWIDDGLAVMAEEKTLSVKAVELFNAAGDLGSLVMQTAIAMDSTISMPESMNEKDDASNGI